MLKRQKILLALLEEATEPLSPTVFMKLCFLLRNETELLDDSTFYAFVPYQYGPFSFALYRELDALSQQSYVVRTDSRIYLEKAMLRETRAKISDLPKSTREAASTVYSRYGSARPNELVRDVYARYPWYATKSERTDLLPQAMPKLASASPAVYTSGYEKQSIDGFFARILRKGIRMIADVRSNPISRKYGFAGSTLSRIAGKLGIGYSHLPKLGIPSAERTTLNTFDSYQRLLDRYESEMLPRQTAALEAVSVIIRSQATALLCVEHDVHCCHRSRLATAVSRRTGLQEVHL